MLPALLRPRLLRTCCWLVLGLLLTPVARAQDLLRIVEEGLADPLEPELAEHAADLQRGGWTVETIYVPKRERSDPFQHITLAESIIWPRLALNPQLHVFLVGACPLPYSGQSINPDGHAGTAGAYACTAYYATPSTAWTDVRDNRGMLPLGRQLNVPDDGKFDQNYLPAAPRAAVGFLDLSVLNAKAWGSTETKPEFTLRKYREWFALCHAYRTGQWRPRHLTANGRDSDRPAQGFWNWSLAEYGVEPLFFSSVEPSVEQPFSIESQAPFGIVYDFKVVTTSASWWAERTAPWAVLYLYYGSFQVDYGCARLMTPLGGGALATSSNAFGGWDLTGASSKTLGELWQQTLTASPAALPLVLYGDPTLKVPGL